jgi:hypothetical protein
MKLIRMVLLALLSATLLTSCKKGVFLLLFNNSGSDVTVASYDTAGRSDLHNIKKGMSKPIPWPTTLSIRFGSNQWTYGSFPVLPKSYVQRTRWGLPDYLKIQLEADGSLHMMPSNAVATLTNFPSQPQGFPLLPDFAASSAH